VMDPHFEAELLAYLDGEMDERERARVEAHLAKCSQCAAELERLRALRQELDATFDTALTPLQLPALADGRIRDRLRARTERRPWWGLWRRRGLIAQGLLALLILVFTLNTTQILRYPPPARPHETLVFGQDRAAPGSRAALRVLVRSAGERAAEAEPIEGAEVVVRVGRTPGLASIVYTGHTDANGTADVAFTIPDELQGQASLVIQTTSAGGEDEIVRPITIARDYKVFLSSDKPVYRRGQTIHVRALALDAVGLRPAAGQEIAFALLDAAGERLETRTVAASDFGVAGVDFSLPPDAIYGDYTLRATLRQAAGDVPGDTVSERTIGVGAYDLPAFRITLETDRSFYGPGERVTGFVRAEYFFGKPVEGGQVMLRGYVGEPERSQAVQLTGKTDEEGTFAFTLDLPPSFGRSALEEPAPFDLEVEVVDTGGRREGIRRMLPVAAQPILIRAIPEGGRIKPGVENAIFILTAYPDGQPAETELTARVDGEKYTLTSGPFGLAEVRHVPAGPVTQIDVRARDAQEAEGNAAFTFEGDRVAQTLLLRAERAVYEVGDTLRAEALVAGAEEGAAQVIYVDVVRAGQMVAALSAPVEDGQAVFVLDLDGTMVGTLELRAYRIYANGSILRDTRVVVVDAPRRVAVAVAADQDRYRPGDVAHLKFQTTITPADQAMGQPVQTALGIGVVDESVYAVESQPPSFAQAYFLLEREMLKRQGHVQGFDVEAGIRAAQDVAARAAWAGVPGTDFTLSAQSTAEEKETATGQAALASRLGMVISLLPLLVGLVAVQGLRPTRVLGRALRRVLIGGLALLLGSPLLALIGGGLMWLLWAVAGVGAPMVILAGVIGLLAGLTVHGWRRPDTRVQLATGLLAAYLALGGLLVVLAARGDDLTGPLLILLVVTFLVVVFALATLGQGLVLEGWSRAGWATTLLGLLLVPLVIYLPFVPGLRSGLTQTLGNPALYAGPVGWVTGCARAPTEAPAEEAMEPTGAVEREAEATAAPTPAPTEAPLEAPTTPTLTPAPAPGEPFPLRQIFPETLYWSAETVTDEGGNLTLDLPLADDITTWRLTALASTQEGELGVATYDLVVFQDFFVDLDLPASITQGEEITVTVTLYNYLPQAQTVRIDPIAAEWYRLVSPPPAVTLAPGGVAATHFSIRAERPGDFSLQVNATGASTSDAVAREVTVEPE